METYTPESYAPAAPAPKKSKTGLIVALVLIALALCCCLLAVLVGGYFYGDAIIEQLSMALSLV